MTHPDVGGTNDVTNLAHEFIQISKFNYAGFVCDKNDLNRRFIVEIFVNNFSVAALPANTYDEALQHSGLGDGCYRFDYVLDPSLITAVCTITARLANMEVELASCSHSSAEENRRTTVNIIRSGSQSESPNNGYVIKKKLGKIFWTGGLNIFGHISFGHSLNARGISQQCTIVVKEGDKVVVEKTVVPWQGIKTSADLGRGDASFTISLPSSFADGVPHKLDVCFTNGIPLEGSPLAIYLPDLITFENDAESKFKLLRSSGISQQYLHTLTCCSVPLDTGYETWSSELQNYHLFPRATSGRMIDIAVIIIGSDEDHLVNTINSLKAALAVDWVAVNVPTSEQCVVFDSNDLKAAIAEIKNSLGERLSDSTPVVVIGVGTVLHPSALHIIGEKLLTEGHLDIVYADYEVTKLEAGKQRKYPKFLPSPDYERWIEQAYPANLFASTFSKISKVLERGITSTYRFCNALIDDSGPSITKASSHLPIVLADCRIPILSNATAHELGEAAISHFTARGLRHCQYALRDSVQSIRVSRFKDFSVTPLSIILETETADSERTKNIISLFQRTSIRFEILTGTGFRIFSDSEPESFAYEQEQNAAIRKKSSHPPYVQNRADELNALISSAKFDAIVIIGSDIEHLSLKWLIEAVDRLHENNVGAVSPVIRYGDGTVREAGVTFGAGFDPVRGLAGTSKTDYGYMDILQTAHERSSLSVSCCVFNRQSWSGCLGFDAKFFPNSYFDVDFFLRFRTKGLRLIVQPCEDVVWVGSEQSLCDVRVSDGMARELAQLRSRWAPLMCNDPSYNPNFGLHDAYHSLAWPPRSLRWRSGRTDVGRF